ncbi:hypothetical protein [uncultured Agrococcus sp.]|uniref:hypothetical protein n=1 Tax=uncultured Agrococcus sp. TaxID=382258 RepID=UPI0025F8497B|nr:hypothetical protein [uncultured Agrococcus sp.]
MRLRLRTLAAGTAIGLLTLTGASGCVFLPGTADSPDVSPEGQVHFACALVAHVSEERGDVGGWVSFVGEDADPGASELAAAASLVGAVGGYTLPDYPELSESGVVVIQGIMTIDGAAIEDGLNQMISACEGVDTDGQADVSQGGQGAYACALAEYVMEEHGEPHTWGSIGQEPAWHMVGSVGALFGGANGYVLPGYESQAESGLNLVTAVGRLDSGTIVAELGSVVAECDD